MNLKINPREDKLGNQSLVCPVCSHKGTFFTIIYIGDSHSFSPSRNRSTNGIAILKCPNLECASLIFVEINDEKTISTFPYKMVDFNSIDIPDKIVATFNEALVCFSNQCYFASGVMIRKTLEELCQIEGAIGANLHQRIEDLKTKITLSNDLKDAISELKLLGNDAAHVELKDFENIGDDEIEVAIEIVKELLKSLYQQKTLVQKIKNLKKITP